MINVCLLQTLLCKAESQLAYNKYLRHRDQRDKSAVERLPFWIGHLLILNENFNMR